MIGSCGESNTRCNASVSSTTPRLGPRWPPVAATLWIRNSRISTARCRSSDWERCCRSAGPRIRSSILLVYAEPPTHRADLQQYPARHTPVRSETTQTGLLAYCPGVPGSLVGGLCGAVRGLPAITRNSGVRHDLHGRRDCAFRADVRVQRRDHDLTPIGCGARILRSGSPPMLSQAYARPQDGR